MQTHIHKNHVYYRCGDQPSALFLSGMHGDESESVSLTEQVIRGMTDSTPDFLYIPRVSPSAVAAKSRKNVHGHDINRQFTDDTADTEAASVMHILKGNRFTRIIDVHEDPDRSQAFYLYDSKVMKPENLDRYRALVHTTGAKLYTGVDDMEDKRLGFTVDRGYISMPPASVDQHSGFLILWTAKHGIADRGFTLEIPGKAPTKLKQLLISALLPFLLYV